MTNKTVAQLVAELQALPQDLNIYFVIDHVPSAVEHLVPTAKVKRDGIDGSGESMVVLNDPEWKMKKLVAT